MNLLLPKTYVERHGRPVVFLAGPIRGAGDWQASAIKSLAIALPTALIVCPVRYAEDHDLYAYRLRGFEDYFESQTAWERHYMKLATETGALLFWIPAESQDSQRPRSEGPYAQDTYGELGEWRGRLMGVPENAYPSIVFGAQPDGLPGLSVIKKNYRYALNIEFLDTLENVLAEVVNRVGVKIKINRSLGHP